MDNNEIKTLAFYRLEQSKENLEEAEALFSINKFKGASNRAYYAIFHAIKAILALEETDFKKHSSVIAYFNKEYISKNIFSRELGKRVIFSNHSFIAIEIRCIFARCFIIEYLQGGKYEQIKDTTKS